MSGESGKLFSFHNVGLFSDHFLSKRLPTESPYWTSEKVAAQTALDNILGQYKKFHSTYKHPNEAQTEDGFIRPVLNTLGYFYIPQTSIKDKGVPDYSLFADEKTKKEAGSLKVKEQEAFYNKSVAICDAKYWGRPLDIKIPGDKRDTFTNINPSFQIVNYLVGANVDWGILTNGKLWRLHYQKASSRSSNFYEVDLEDLLLKGDIERFLYFYLFFRKDAFIKGSHGKSFLDQVLEGSTHYATELSDLLKEKVFEEIFPHLSRGFLYYRQTGMGIQAETDETLKEIYNGTLTLLYRLLFILYAEDRDLLPVKETAYRHYSLAKIKEKVAELRDKKVTLSEISTDLWSDLDTLSKIIDIGDPKLNVPTYNGGLFSHKNPKNDFLKTNRVPDPWLAEALDHLTREEDRETGKLQSIDYAELEVRHLGSIYEGLLEFHLKPADEDKAIVKEKGREVYKPVADVKNPKEIVKKGEFYLENDKHERKSTGSYYTPDYIVKYIVQNAVGPVLEEKLQKVGNLFDEVESLRAKARRASMAKRLLTQELNVKKQQAFDELFSIKVLDPAMGSGHFLVETVDFLSDHIIKFLIQYPENSILEEIDNLRSTILTDLKKKGIQIDEHKLTPTNLVKRMVMKRCIYGVDLNPMAVELAKLSLWLHSFTLGAPLSFLDHHLRCGNSLIGTTVETVKGGMEEVKVGEEGRYVDSEGREKIVPEQKAMYLFGSQFAGLLSATELMRQVGELTDSTFEEVQESQEKYEKAADALKPFKLILDLWTSEHFGNKDAQRFLTHGGDVEAFLKGNSRLSKKLNDLRQETETISQTKRFFHWELEFPEVFYEGSREMENSGFDVVIGNPPWGGELSTEEKTFFRLFGTDTSTPNSYIYFVRQGELLLNDGGFAGWILPDSILVKDYAITRQNLLQENTLLRIAYLERAFKDVNHDSAIVIFRRGRKDEGKLLGGIVPRSETSIETYLVLFERINFDMPELEFRFNLNLTPKNGKLYRRLAALPKIGNIGDFHEGIHTGNIRDKLFYTTKPTYADPSKIKPCLIGGSYDDEFGRYYYRSGGNWTIYDEALIRKDLGDYASLRDEEIFIGPKLYVTRTGDDFFGFYDEHHYASNNLFSFKFKQKNVQFSYLFLMAILNSMFAQRYNRLYLAPRFGELFTETKIIHLKLLPLPHIAFLLSETQRARFLEKGKKLYEQCLAKNDFLCVTGFVDHCLNQKPEQADVVHDLLAFLAERMMEMNKAKQAETKGFLEWLEANIGVRVDSLKNKTKISAYHEGSLEGLLEILKENRKVLKVNPASKDFFDTLKDAFQKSLAKLTPLKDQLATTDRLIDLIVYRLYGLTEAEIKIVEGS